MQFVNTHSPVNCVFTVAHHRKDHAQCLSTNCCQLVVYTHGKAAVSVTAAGGAVFEHPASRQRLVFLFITANE